MRITIFDFEKDSACNIVNVFLDIHGNACKYFIPDIIAQSKNETKLHVSIN